MAVLCASITVYLISLKQKTKDLRFLIGAFSCWTLHFLFSICDESLSTVHGSLTVCELCIGLVGLVLFVGFAYNFRGSRYPNEFRLGFALATALVAACSFVLVRQILLGVPPNRSVGSGASVVLFLWAEAVLIRKWIGAASRDEGRPFRDFAVIFFLSIAAVAVFFLRDIRIFPTDVASVICNLLYLSTLVGFTLVYVNHSAIPTTFRVKIVGATLFSVLAVLTVAWTFVIPAEMDVSTPSTRVAGITSAHLAARAARTSYRGFADQQGMQGAIIRYNYCILGSALFVLGFFPVFFRLSMVKPLHALLDAVDRVDAGARNLQLPVQFNDEIGRVTIAFNAMTRNLKAAEDDLRAYAESLEVKIQERTAELARKNEESERLLLNILPASIADRLKRGDRIIADACSATSILFADIVGFTDLSSRMPASEVVELLSDLISEFDRLAEKHGVQKIKTIGDAYMAVAGLPDARPDHADAAIRLAMDMLDAVARRKTRDGRSLQLRIGINSGPVVAGVIGTHKFAYDIWGDAVNTASRMESHGEPGRVQVTEATYDLLKDEYAFESRGAIFVKGKGLMSTYLLCVENENSAVMDEHCLHAAA
ncbi:MAG: adenylate/guanylate cyclase domain-containing protein [Bryobacteraceae bacterium]